MPSEAASIIVALASSTAEVSLNSTQTSSRTHCATSSDLYMLRITHKHADLHAERQTRTHNHNAGGRRILMRLKLRSTFYVTVFINTGGNDHKIWGVVSNPTRYVSLSASLCVMLSCVGTGHASYQIPQIKKPPRM